MEPGRQGHPLLQGGRKNNSHGLSTNQIQTLAAMCEAFLPPLPPDAVSKKFTPLNDAARSFLDASGSHPPLPDEVFTSYTGHRTWSNLVLN